MEYEDLSLIFNDTMREIEADQERFWCSLSPDDQLRAFCAVCRRLKKGELDMQASYRYILYNLFGFGKEAYSQAQDAGFLALHNAIFHIDQEQRQDLK
jgi:hypothetical protein